MPVEVETCNQIVGSWGRVVSRFQPFGASHGQYGARSPVGGLEQPFALSRPFYRGHFQPLARKRQPARCQISIGQSRPLPRLPRVHTSLLPYTPVFGFSAFIRTVRGGWSCPRHSKTAQFQPFGLCSSGQSRPFYRGAFTYFRPCPDDRCVGRVCRVRPPRPGRTRKPPLTAPCRHCRTLQLGNSCPFRNRVSIPRGVARLGMLTMLDNMAILATFKPSMRFVFCKVAKMVNSPRQWPSCRV